MSVIVVISLSAKEGSVDELKKYFKEILPDTRSFEGCQGVQLYENAESSTKLILHGKWASEDAQKKYIAWRMKTGAVDKLGSMLSEPLSMQLYNIVDE